MPKYLIELEVPNAAAFSAADLGASAALKALRHYASAME